MKLNLCFFLFRYSFEAVVAHTLKLRVPYWHPSTLYRWYLEGSRSGSCTGTGKGMGAVEGVGSSGRQSQARVLRHVIRRAELNLELVGQLDLVNRTSELARMFGMQFESVLSRGSQYR